MAEDVKQTENTDSCCAGKTLKTIVKVLLGVLLLAVGIMCVVVFRRELLTLVLGGLGLFLILAGVVTLAIAKE